MAHDLSEAVFRLKQLPSAQDVVEEEDDNEMTEDAMPRLKKLIARMVHMVREATSPRKTSMFNAHMAEELADTKKKVTELESEKDQLVREKDTTISNLQHSVEDLQRQKREVGDLGLCHAHVW